MALRDIARVIRAEIEETMNVVSDIRIPGGNRNAVGTALLRASADHARAASLVVDLSGAELVAAAGALSRTHLDTLLRGMFFMLVATEEELDYFCRKDDMPKRPNEVGQLVRLGPNNLSHLVADALELPGLKEKFARMVKVVWRASHTFVHGGTGLVSGYAASEEIGANFDERMCATLLSFMSFGVELIPLPILKASGLSLDEQQPILARLSDVSRRRAERMSGFQIEIASTTN